MQKYQHSVEVEFLLPGVGQEVAQSNNGVVEINSDCNHVITGSEQFSEPAVLPLSHACIPLKLS